MKKVTLTIELSPRANRVCGMLIGSLNELVHTGDRIMSKLSGFVTAQRAFNEKLTENIDTIGQAVQGVDEDVKNLKDQIDKLQTTSGEISPEDQALLDQLQSDASALVDKSGTLANAAKALDDLTPPAIPQ